eukprot:2217821-Prymnesium_polylepis.1
MKEGKFDEIKFVLLSKGLATCNLLIDDERKLKLFRCCLKKECDREAKGLCSARDAFFASGVRMDRNAEKRSRDTNKEAAYQEKKAEAMRKRKAAREARTCAAFLLGA